jgi:SAM-dependent methyltransferase
MLRDRERLSAKVGRGRGGLEGLWGGLGRTMRQAGFALARRQVDRAQWKGDMHDTAYEIGRLFFEIYARPGDFILDVGSSDINGSLRDFEPEGSWYIGVDLEAGKGVDVVVGQISQLPFAAESFDIVVSTSCLEHDRAFWVTFLEMCRVVKRGAYLYLNAPSRGTYHQFPIDAWRFFPDAGLALRDWARANHYGMDLLESFITENKNEAWNDCVMVFVKEGEPSTVSLADRYDVPINIRSWPRLGEVRRRRDQW